MENREGPATCLGIELDTEAMAIRLPQFKLLRLKLMLQRWMKLKILQEKRPLIPCGLTS